MPHRLGDAETRRQLADLKLSERPLLALDVDEVVLHFVDPFMAFLKTGGFELQPRSFSLSGNIVAMDHGAPVDDVKVSALIADFFDAQSAWQTPVDGAVDAIARLQRNCDVVLLTAMPGRYGRQRAGLLAQHGVDAPLITATDAKGLVLAIMHGDRDKPLAFVDDIHVNLASVKDHMPAANVIHFMANTILTEHLPPLPDGVAMAGDWAEIEDLVQRGFQNTSMN